MESQTCSFRSWDQRPVTFDWCTEYKACPSVPPFIVDSVFEIEPMPSGPFQHDSSDPEANRQALGNEPISLAYDPINERMYVTNSFDNTASVINFC